MWRIKAASAGIFLTLLFAAACISYQVKPKAVAEVFEDAAQESQVAAEVPPSAPAEVQSVPVEKKRRVYLKTENFDQSFLLNVTQQNEYAEVQSPEQHASLPRVVVTVPREEPKKVTAPIPKKKKEWDEMSGFERRSFVIGYINANHLECPKSGKDPAGEAKELSEYGWLAVRVGIWGFCSSKKS